MKQRTPEKLESLLMVYVGITKDYIASLTTSEILILLENNPDIDSLWKYIGDENERTRRKIGSLRLKVRLSQIPSYKKQEKNIGPILWERLYGSCVKS